MSNLTNFNNFELNTEETTNVEGGWGCRRRRTSYSSYNCYSNNDCYSSYNSCEPAVEAAPVEEIIEVAPVVEAPKPPIELVGIQGA